MPTQIRALIPTTPQDDCISITAVTKTPYHQNQNKDMHDYDTLHYVDFVCELGNNGHHISVQSTNDQMASTNIVHRRTLSEWYNDD